MKKYSFALLIVIVLFGTFLRFYRITEIPPGLYIDEAAIGYSADKILHTGKDEYGVRFPLMFQSLGDYKMPGYIYLVTGSMAFFGKTEFAVRFPSALFGSLTILLLYFFVEELLIYAKDSFLIKNKRTIALLSTVLLAISPWHLQFSRAGFEVNVGLFFFLLGAYLLLRYYENKRIIFLVFGVLSFVTTFYLYHIFRLLTPIALALILGFFVERKVGKRKQLLLVIISAAILMLPMFLYSFTANGSFRLAQTSAFPEYPTNSLFQKMYTYPMVYFKDYLSFFSTQFLFIFGDGFGRHQIPEFGVLPFWQIPFLPIGFLYLLTSKKSLPKTVIFVFLFLSPIAAAVARPSPHALRSLPMVIPLQILIALGIMVIITKYKNHFFVLSSIISVIALGFFIYYLHFYYVHYPKTNIPDWGLGNKEVVQSAGKLKNNYDYVVVDSNLSLANVYFHFYDDSIQVKMVNQAWTKPKDWQNKRILYLRPYYGQKTAPGLIQNIIIPNQNHDIYAQFWQI